MAYKVLAQDVAAPFSHMVFYSIAQLDKKAEKLIGVKSVSPLQEVAKTNVRWCLEENNSLALAKAILAKLKNKEYYKKIITNSYNSLKKFHRAADAIKNKNFQNNSNKQLSDELKKYMNIWVEATLWGHIVNMSDFHFNLLSDKVFKIVADKIKIKALKLDTARVFSILTTPIKPSMLVEQDIDFYKLLAEIQKSKETKNKLEKPTLRKKITQHAKKYDWLQYHYLGPTILDEKYFIELLKSSLKQKENGRKKINQIMKRGKETVKEQKELMEKIKFNKEEIYWIKIAQEFGYLKGLRKEITFIACRSMDGLIKQIAHRLGLSMRQLQFMALEEICEALKGNKIPDINILNQRIKYCIIYHPKGKVKIYTGKEAKKLAKKIKEDKLVKNIDELKGTPAYPGKARGTIVNVFNEGDIKKMKKGRILVSPATNPNVMPAIIKAAAIVTDEGGVTCHAAIVSRELKIPCVIGTKIATRVLKDGDKVEVDATKGLIKKI